MHTEHVTEFECNYPPFWHAVDPRDQHTYLLTYSTVQSPSWAANWFAANQEIPRISRNPKVHYRTHKRPPTVSILGQPNPVHIPTSHLLQIHPNIHPSTPRSPQWSVSLRFPHQDPIHSPLTHSRHMPSPSHSSWYWMEITNAYLRDKTAFNAVHSNAWVNKVRFCALAPSNRKQLHIALSCCTQYHWPHGFTVFRRLT